MIVTPRQVRLRWLGPVAEFMRLATPPDGPRYVDLEGAFRSGKTTAALWRVHRLAMDHPGMNWLVCRYGDEDTQSLLTPLWRDLCQTAGTPCRWQATGQYDQLPNGSRVFLLGLKAVDQPSRYAKIRGRSLGGIYVDQAEELPYDIYLELTGRLSQPGMPHQLMLTPNPPAEDHWIAREFPIEGHVRDHWYGRLNVYDNAHNLPPDVIRALEAAYPEAHAKHRSAVLGLRGMNVIGQPVYQDSFRRAIHGQPLAPNAALPLLEGLDFGRHHPCVVWAQHTVWGQWLVLGGLLGQDIVLEEFIQVLLATRRRLFGEVTEVHTICDPAGAHPSGQGLATSAVEYLRACGLSPRALGDANVPTVRLTQIERLKALMRRRTGGGEGFGVHTGDPVRFWRVHGVGGRMVPMAFIADALEAGYVWDPHPVSVGRRLVERPKKDGLWEHGMNALEYLVHAEGAVIPSPETIGLAERRLTRRVLRRAQADADPDDRRDGARPRHRRGWL